MGSRPPRELGGGSLLTREGRAGLQLGLWQKHADFLDCAHLGKWGGLMEIMETGEAPPSRPTGQEVLTCSVNS